MTKLSERMEYWKALNLPAGLLAFAALAILAGILSSALLNQPVLLVLPFGLFALFVAIVDLRALYFLLWASIPLSTEVFFSSGIGTDIPSEPLMLLLSGVGLLYVLARLPVISFRILFHPVTAFLILHFGWILLTTMQSDDPLVSLKFALAKSWYIIAFFGFTWVFIKDSDSYRKWVIWVLVPLVFTMVVIFIKHAFAGFSFVAINNVVPPFYRNHVNYACILAVFFPFVVLSYRMFAKGSLYRRVWPLLILFFLVAIQLSYTRAAYIGVVVAAAAYIIIRFRLVKIVLSTSGVVICLFVAGMAYQNRYIDFAPDYERTITHYKFDNLIEATYKFEDISTMERFYRWIGGVYMIRESPLFGYGPGNFHTFYKSYTDRNFMTYVSDNPERSGVHNYFIMTMADQGIPGLLIFVILIVISLLTGEKLYHRFKPQPFKQDIVLASSMSLYVILFILLLNDMLETDKVGAFFFLNLALLTRLDTGFTGMKQEVEQHKA